MAVSKRLRYEVLRRDGHRCHYCGVRASAAPLTVDHIVPKTLGGTDQSSNLVTACFDCNAGKSSTRPDESLVRDVANAEREWSSSSGPYREAAEFMFGILPGFDFDAERARLADDFDEVTAEDENEDGTPREYAWPADLKALAQCVQELVDLRDWVNFTVNMLRKELDPEKWKYHVAESIQCHETAGHELDEGSVLRYVVTRALREYINSCARPVVGP